MGLLLTVNRNRVDAIRRGVMTIQANTTDSTSSTATDRAILLVVCLVALLGFVAVITMTG
jgi:hypothetical protein